MKPIDIKKQLPKVGERILVYVPQEKKWFFDELRKLSLSDGGGVELSYWYLHNVSHWIPCPETP